MRILFENAVRSVGGAVGYDNELDSVLWIVERLELLDLSG
jgi:hypothetical protein